MQTHCTNKKQTQSIILLATYNTKNKFTFIDTGFPDSVHDNGVFTSSSLYAVMANHSQSYFPSIPYHIRGDSAFSCSTHVMVPFRDTGRLTHEVRYNKTLFKTRVITERAFGMLKTRFRSLHNVDADVRISNIIVACSILLNITSNFLEEEATPLREGPIEIEDNINPVIDIALPKDTPAADKRSFLAKFKNVKTVSSQTEVGP